MGRYITARLKKRGEPGGGQWQAFPRSRGVCGYRTEKPESKTFGDRRQGFFLNLNPSLDPVIFRPSWETKEKKDRRPVEQPKMEELV